VKEQTTKMIAINAGGNINEGWSKSQLGSDYG